MENLRPLPDFDEWKRANRDSFDIWDYLYVIIGIKKIYSDIIFAFLQLFWLGFVEKENYVFLKQQFREKRFLEEEKRDALIWLK